MSLDRIEFIAANAEIRQIAFGAAAGGATMPFAAVMQQQFGQLNQVLHSAESASMRLASGQSDNLHQVMIGIEHARIAFQLAVQVRNRLMEAYQDVARMQL
jgi:flagellar hook-basal body complex protein FliE